MGAPMHRRAFLARMGALAAGVVVAPRLLALPAPEPEPVPPAPSVARLADLYKKINQGIFGALQETTPEMTWLVSPHQRDAFGARYSYNVRLS